MKRYEHFCSYDGGGPAEPQEDEHGDWVRYEDAQAELEQLRATLAESCDEHRSNVYEAGPGGGCILLADAVAAERERWRRIADAAQAITTGSDDRIEIFRVPAHLMAALALALDDAPTAPGPAP